MPILILLFNFALAIVPNDPNLFLMITCNFSNHQFSVIALAVSQRIAFIEDFLCSLDSEVHSDTFLVYMNDLKVLRDLVANNYGAS